MLTIDPETKKDRGYFILKAAKYVFNFYFLNSSNNRRDNEPINFEQKWNFFSLKKL
jgi:hypothetical protein